VGRHLGGVSPPGNVRDHLQAEDDRTAGNVIAAGRLRKLKTCEATGGGIDPSSGSGYDPEPAGISRDSGRRA
jgi:hypothetical protein